MTSQNYINHIALVLDASSSMNYRAKELISVADGQIAYLARRSKELNQETRITVYVFNHQAKCVIYDMDVLRLPSIADVYKPLGNTALIDATILSQADLALTSQKYGDHSFLTFVLTDGEENVSIDRPGTLAQMLRHQTDNWTVAVLVPDMRGKSEAKRFGFPADNIAIWDINSAAGVSEVGETIRKATDSYMVARSTGIRGTKTLFSTGADAVNKATVTAAGLTPLPSSQFFLVPVPRDTPIKEFVEQTGRTYMLGKALYQLSKTETIQGNKTLAVVENATAKVFLGPEARSLVGLGDTEVRVKPDFNPEFTIYVQSTSVNRKLIAGTKLLLLN